MFSVYLAGWEVYNELVLAIPEVIFYRPMVEVADGFHDG